MKTHNSATELSIIKFLEFDHDDKLEKLNNSTPDCYFMVSLLI